jgi:aminoglycoside 3-N-acetyltransferase-4
MNDTSPLNRSARIRELRHSHAASIDRLRGMVWTGDHAALCDQFNQMGSEVEAAVEAIWAAPAPSLQADAAVATTSPPPSPRLADDAAARGARVPRRLRPLAPTMENVWPVVKAKWSTCDIPKWVIYFADGERSIADIAALAALHARAEIGRIIEFFDLMSELGWVELIAPDDFVSREKLTDDLRALGLTPRMDVMVHSSLRSIGPVRGGATTVIEAMLAAIAPGGTLLAPSFNHFDAKVFNPLTTPTTNGAIAQALWRRSDALRSTHPSHAVAAIGPRAAEYLADHLQNGIWAANSPIGRLVDAGGCILSLGVGHDRSTVYHVAEISLDVSCLDSFGSRDAIIQSDGTLRTVPGLAWRNGNCPADPRLLDRALDERHLQKRGLVGRAVATLARAADIWTLRREMLAGKCETCGIHPLRRNA